MSFRIRQIEYTADHRRIVRDRDVALSTLTIGRDAGNDIALPDLAVEPQHAVLTLSGQRVTVQATGTLGFEVDGRPTREIAIDPAAGASLRFGSYTLGIQRDADGANLIEIENAALAGAYVDPDADKRGFSLHSALRIKRGTAWGLLFAILALFLAWPVISHFTHTPTAPTSTAASHVTGDKAWNPGPLSLAHQGLTDKCEACHVKAFQSVRNETCQGCHKNVLDHADPARIAEAHGRAGLGQAMLNKISVAFGREKPGACVDCHVEHAGAKAMPAPAQKFCSDCHATLREQLPDTKLGNAADFGTAHPEFAAMIVTNAESRAKTRVSLDAHPHEDSGLTFSHRVHLDANGGVAKMARTLGQYGKPLECASCHAKSADAVSFRPVSMEQNCEGCHSLAYAQAGGTVLKLRHGDLDQALADLRRAGPQPMASPARTKPGQFASGGLYSANFGVQHTAADPLAKDGMCGECHTRVIRGGKPAIGHVTLTNRYMPGGWFDHSAHEQTPCTDCHLAKQSTKSSDVLLPGIKDCRDCHLGEGAAPPKIASGCVMCHAYHVSAGAPTFTRRHSPKPLARQIETDTLPSGPNKEPAVANRTGG